MLLYVMFSAVALSAGPLEQRSASATAKSAAKPPSFPQATVLGQKSPELPPSIIRILTAQSRLAKCRQSCPILERLSRRHPTHAQLEGLQH
ncbi:MAG TPA: hypothetical protein VNJ02_03590 [Vicinamibacterales bacterium]|nr:hypothetical protein [Vicinamibacterales bacterium]